MQELVELRGVDTATGLLAGDQALLDHFDGDTQGGGGGALAHARLEHPELALLDGELDIAHIAVMILERQENALELLARGLEARGGLEVGDGLGVADAGDNVLALGIHQKVAVELLGAVGRVAREGDAGRGGLPLVAKRHGLHVDGGAELVGNAVLLAVEAGAIIDPGAKDGLDGKAQLELRIVREDGLAVDDLELGVRSASTFSEKMLLKVSTSSCRSSAELGIGGDAGGRAWRQAFSNRSASTPITTLENIWIKRR